MSNDPTQQKPTPAPLTQIQRIQIRNFLDKHFDDSTGFYLEGFSDQKIADQLKVPRIHVETIRETAYGPLKLFPALEKARNELEAIKREISVCCMQLEQLTKRAKALQEQMATTKL